MKFYIGSGFKSCELVNEYSSLLTKSGWKHTYNWVKDIHAAQGVEDLVKYAEWEQRAIASSDVVVILLPAGRGTHVELGMALALEKKIFLCSAAEREFYLENTVNFYQLPSLVRLVGTAEENVAAILKDCSGESRGAAPFR